MKHFFIPAVAAFICTAVFSQAGTLDNTFSSDGKTTIGLAFGGVAGEDDCAAVAIQSDGKIVLAGRTNATSGGDFNFLVMRLNTDGTLDKSFNGKGYISINFSGHDEAAAVAIQPDGKIVVAGTADFGSSIKIAVVRLLNNGVPDPTFGNLTGKVITDLGNHTNTYSMTIQNNGKIIVAGAYYGSLSSSIGCFLVRYNTDGSLDQTFGVLGRSLTNFGQGETAHSVAIQPDGKIVIGGNSNSTLSYFLVARFTSSGLLDGTFGSNGKTSTHFGEGDYCSGIAIQGDGKIVAAGSTYVTTDKKGFAVVRYNTNGTIDNTLSEDGKVTTKISSSSFDQANAVTIQSDGKIVVAGSTVTTSNFNFALVRYNINGTLDNTFSGDGKTTTDFGNNDGNDDEAYAVKIQSNGKIVAAGTRNKDHAGNFAVARYHGDNALQIASSKSSSEVNKLSNDKVTSHVRLFPDPATNILHIEGLNTSAPKTISIIDMNGRILQTTSTGNSTHTWNIASLPAGTYYLLIDDKKKKMSLKFVKE